MHSKDDIYVKALYPDNLHHSLTSSSLITEYFCLLFYNGLKSLNLDMMHFTFITRMTKTQSHCLKIPPSGQDEWRHVSCFAGLDPPRRCDACEEDEGKAASTPGPYGDLCRTTPDSDSSSYFHLLQWPDRQAEKPIQVRWISDPDLIMNGNLCTVYQSIPKLVVENFFLPPHLFHAWRHSQWCQ